jgi:hypothetical protein
VFHADSDSLDKSIDVIRVVTAKSLAELHPADGLRAEFHA